MSKHVQKTVVYQELQDLSGGDIDTKRSKLEVESVLKQLRILVQDDTPGLDIMTDVLLKAEVWFARLAQHPSIDADTRKTIEDIAALIITAKQIERNKEISDRLQIISEESQKALESIRRAGVPVVKATEEAVDFLKTWKPVLLLLICSGGFRQIYNDSVKIARSIIARKGQRLMEDISKKFEGLTSEQTNETTEQLGEKSNSQFTDEEWETILNQIQRIFIILSREPTYRLGINQLFNLFDIFRRMNLKKNLPNSSDMFAAETHIRRAQLETEELVANFAGRETLDHFKRQLINLIEIFDQNPDIRNYLYELKQCISRTMSEEEVMSPEFRNKSREYVNRGRELMKQVKEEEVEDFFKSADELLNKIKNDDFVKILRQQAKAIRSDLSYVDADGTVRVDIDMLSKLQSVLLPILAETLQYIPMPRMESTDPDQDFWLDNITLCGFDIIPDYIDFNLESKAKISLKDIQSRGSHTKLVIRLDPLRTELKDMKFYFKKKTFPVLEDSGIVTVRIGGEGAELIMNFTVIQKPGESTPRLTEGHANVNIRNMDIEFDKASLDHDLLIPMMTTVFKKEIQLQIEKVVAINLSKIVQKMGDRITQALVDVNRPFFVGLETARQVIKSSEFAEVYAKRREKLLE